MDELRYEELFKRFIVSAHGVERVLHSSERFDDWTAMEVLTLRSFQRVWNHTSCASAVARDLRCSVSYAARLIRRLRERGLLSEGPRCRPWRAMRLTPAGIASLESDADYLETFARSVFEGHSEEDRLHLVTLFGTVLGNLRRLEMPAWG